MKAIIPIGGRGTRMRPVTFTANKHFIPVGNKPLVFYPIEAVVAAGVKEIAITYNPGQLEFAKSFLGDGEKWNVEFTYVLQEKPAGLANIVQVCEDWVGNDKFFLHLGDNIFVDGIRDFVDYFEHSKAHGMVAMLHHPQNRRMGVPYFDDSGRLVRYVEKPQDPPHDMAIPGLYFADAQFFTMFKGTEALKPSARGELEIPDAYQWLIDHDLEVLVKEYQGTWLDPGKFDDWLETNQYLLDTTLQRDVPADVDGNSHIEGRVKIGMNCVIKNSTIRGPVSIGDDCVVEESFVGPYTSIYHHSRVIDCHIENSVLMESVDMEHIERPIDSSIIGPYSEVAAKTKKNMSLFIGEMSKIEM